MQGPQNGQFLRFWKLTVYGSQSQPANGVVITSNAIGSNGAEGLRMQFLIGQSDNETPNFARIRVYNLSKETRNRLLATNTNPTPDNQHPSAQNPNHNFTKVVLEAGYVTGNRGVIFLGDILQFKFGNSRNVDSYLDIYAASGDVAYNSSVVNVSFPAGTTLQQEMQYYAKRMGVPLSKQTDDFLQATGGIQVNMRTKVAYGLTRSFVREVSSELGCRWSIQNDQLVLVPDTSFLPGAAVAINSKTGMVGFPEVTDNGITVRCYLNPLIEIGQRIQINNAELNQAVLVNNFFPKVAPTFFASTAADGIYRVMVAECSGDTRGNDWFSDLTCLAVDSSSGTVTNKGL